MKYKRFNNKLIVRGDRGEDLMEELKALCRKEAIHLGSIQGIAAMDEIQVGLYDVSEQVFHPKTFKGEYEVPSLLGNISESETGDVYLHLHITFSDKEMRAYGGHLIKGRISGTAELVIDVVDGQVKRFKDDKETGLNLYDLA